MKTASPQFLKTLFVAGAISLSFLPLSSRAAILVGQNGINDTATVIDFAVTPVVGDWSTEGINGGANSITTVAELNSAVQTMTTAFVSTALPLLNPNDYSVVDNFSYQQLAQHLSSAPKSKAANVLLATLNNNSGATILSFDAVYDFGILSSVAEEVPGFYLYYSTTGLANSWVSLGADTVAGTQIAGITPGGGWLSGTNLYLLWADDNATGNTSDSVLTVDNFRVNNVTTNIPEPGRASLLMLASVLFFLRRRR